MKMNIEQNLFKDMKSIEQATEEYCSRLSWIMKEDNIIDTLSGKCTRKLCITPSRAYYGSVSAAIIEFEGSPPRCSVVITNLKNYPEDRSIIINNITLKRGSKRHLAVVELVSDFLEFWARDQNIIL